MLGGKYCSNENKVLPYLLTRFLVMLINVYMYRDLCLKGMAKIRLDFASILYDTKAF